MPSARRGRPPTTPVPDPTWGDRVRALRYVPQLVRLVWNTHPAYTADHDGAPHCAGVRSGRHALDREAHHRSASSALRGTHGSATPLWHLVAVEIAIVFVGELLARASSLVESLLGDLFSNHTSVRLMEHAATLDLAQFEDPDVLRPARARAAADDGAHRAARAAARRWAQDVAHARHARRRARACTARGCCCCSRSPCCRAFSARRTSRRSSTRCSSGGRRSGGSSTTCATSARATRRRRKCRCSGSRGWLIERYRVLAERFYEENKRLLDPQGDRQQRCSRSSARSATTPRTSIILAARGRRERSRSAR